MVTTTEVEPLGDKELFKLPNQNSFYVRNKHYRQQLQQDTDFKSPYVLQAGSIKVGADAVTATVLKNIKTLESPVELALTVRFFENSVRITLDEVARRDGKTAAKKRYDEVDQWSLEKIEYSQPKGSDSVYQFGNGNELVIQHSPLALTVRRHGEDQVVLNGRGLMNFEHFRTREENSKHLSKYEVHTGMWEDTFKIHTDSKEYGPEAVSIDAEFVGYEHVHGIPEHAEGIELRDTNGKGDKSYDIPYRLFNLDAFEYDVDSPKALYGAIPLMQAHRKGNSAALFWVNASDTYVDIERGVQDSKSTHTNWVAEAGLLDLVVFLGDKPADILQSYGKFTGFSQLPQLFVLGYHQCRWNYYTQDEVQEVHDEFDTRDIPFDVIWLDIEYTDKKKYFTWNTETFPDHLEMTKMLDKKKRKLVPIIDPHIRVDDEYDVYADITSKHLAITDKQGQPFHGQCWPGESIWIDSLNPDTSVYWKSFYSTEHNFAKTANNVHIWNDMNEPACFNAPENTMDKSALHHGGWEHRQVHNIYGMSYVKCTFDALNARYEQTQRPFVLSRSFFAGSQRYGAVWTGDNMAKWTHLKASLPMIMTANISGLAQIGADAGGFFFEPESDELVTRWYQAAAFYPFFRGHAHIETKPREPWTRGEPHTSIIRQAIKTRYRLLPVIYTAFYHASVDGTPVMKPMFWDFSQDELYGMQDQFFVGNSGLLVKPVTDEGAREVSIYLPDDELHYVYSSREVLRSQGSHTVPAPLDTIPLFVRGGSIHARKDTERPSSELMAADPYTLVLAVSANGSAQGDLYFDDGISYKNQAGDYVHAEFTFEKGLLLATVDAPNASESLLNVKIDKLEVYGDISASVSAEVYQEGKSWTAKVVDGNIVGLNLVAGRDWSIKF